MNNCIWVTTRDLIFLFPKFLYIFLQSMFLKKSYEVHLEDQKAKWTYLVQMF